MDSIAVDPSWPWSKSLRCSIVTKTGTETPVALQVPVPPDSCSHHFVETQSHEGLGVKKTF